MPEATRYDHLEGWAQEFRISTRVLARRLHDVAPIPGTGKDGKLVHFYAEEDVRRVCADLLVNQKTIGVLIR